MHESAQPALPEIAPFFRRRRWALLGIPLATIVLSLFARPAAPVGYTAHMALALDVPPALVVPGSDASAAKVGETLIDDISRIIGGDQFAAAVERRLGTDTQVTAGEISSSLSATDRHRVLDIAVTRSVPPSEVDHTDLDRLRASVVEIALAAAEELETNGGEWFATLGAEGASLSMVDAPDVAALQPTLRHRLELPLRWATGLFAGIVVALVWEAWDPTLYDSRSAARAVGAPVVGAVPRRPKAGRR